jgi:pimeloyl-ACP methyl ester carboxylesterase
MTQSNVTRRRVLGGVSAGVALGTITGSSDSMRGAARAQPTRKTFVLVHGAFCGSWIWRRVADQLEHSGHKVFVPALTGLGERSHLLRKEVDLDTHIADVVNLIKWESLENVCLVAWSYAGFVGSGALESIGNRVSSIVWLDAFLPANGHKVVDLTAFGNAVQTAVDKGETGFGPPPKLSAIFVAESDPPRRSSPRNRSAASSSRSTFPGRSRRCRRRHTSASQNFHSRPSIRRLRTARATRLGLHSSCRTRDTWPCSMRRTAYAN